jgi:hypothetical protein
VCAAGAEKKACLHFGGAQTARLFENANFGGALARCCRESGRPLSVAAESEREREKAKSARNENRFRAARRLIKNPIKKLSIAIDGRAYKMADGSAAENK